MPALCNNPAIPKRGWRCVNVDDLGPAKQGDHQLCEWCGVRWIRYVHHMKHPDWPEEVEAGCECAGQLEGDPNAPKEREREARKKARSRAKWMTLEWAVNAKGNYVLRYQGLTITIFPDARRQGHWKAALLGHFSNSYPTIEALKWDLWDAVQQALKGEFPLKK